MYKIYLFLIILSFFSNATTLCVTSTPTKPLCQEKNNTIILTDINNTKESIFSIQSAIREKIDNREQVILIGEKQDAILLAIAQANLLPYYRKNIKGLVLKEPKNIDLKQMDWYWSKCVVMDSNQIRRKTFKEAFEKNGIEYKFVTSDIPLELEKWFPVELKCKVEPKQVVKKPDYYGAILHLGFGQILYQPKGELVEKSSDYGFDKRQKYTVFYKKDSTKNPLFIYVHGGDWKSGAREDSFGLCQQYADRGYTAVSINYRLLDLPKVGMQEMVEDVREAIKNVMESAKSYKGDREKTIIMADRAGAMLSYMALSKLPKGYQPKRVVFYAIPTDFGLFSKERQKELSGIEDEANLTRWIEKYSPLSAQNLEAYTPSTLVIQELDDNITAPKHLEDLEVQSVIHNNNIRSLWVEESLESKYQDITSQIDNFIQ